MASTNKLNTPPPDSLLTLRTNDGTEVSADVLTWLDTGAGYPLGDLAATNQVPAQRCVLVVDFDDTTQTSGGDNIDIKLLLTSTEGSTAGEGDTGAGDLQTITLRALTTSDDAFAKKLVFEVDNEHEGTFYRFMGFQIDFSASGAATYGAYVVPAGSYGIS